MVQTNRISHRTLQETLKRCAIRYRRRGIPVRSMPPVPDIKKLLAEMSIKKKRLQTLAGKVTSHAATPLTKATIIRYHEEAKQIWEIMTDLYCQIQLAETDDAKKPLHETEYDACEITADQTTEGFEAILLTFAADPSASSSSGSGTSGKAKPKLPEIRVPNFSGNPSEWITFRDLYTNAVHNASIADSMKMTYLKSLLSGNAAKLVQSMPISDANYPVAWDIVTSRFENRRQLFMTIAKEFVKHQGVTADPESLNSLVCAANQFSQAIDSMKITDKWATILMFLTYQKLDQVSKQLWEMSMPNKQDSA